MLSLFDSSQTSFFHEICICFATKFPLKKSPKFSTTLDFSYYQCTRKTQLLIYTVITHTLEALQLVTSPNIEFRGNFSGSLLGKEKRTENLTSRDQKSDSNQTSMVYSPTFRILTLLENASFTFFFSDELRLLRSCFQRTAGFFVIKATFMVSYFDDTFQLSH